MDSPLGGRTEDKLKGEKAFQGIETSIFYITLIYSVTVEKTRLGGSIYWGNAPESGETCSFPTLGGIFYFFLFNFYLHQVGKIAPFLVGFSLLPTSEEKKKKRRHLISHHYTKKNP